MLHSSEYMCALYGPQHNSPIRTLLLNGIHSFHIANHGVDLIGRQILHLIGSGLHHVGIRGLFLDKFLHTFDIRNIVVRGGE